MTIDPICGMTVDEASALHAERDGQTFYFCSDHCRQKFLAPHAAQLKLSAARKSDAAVDEKASPRGRILGGQTDLHLPDAPRSAAGPSRRCPKCGMTLEPKTVTAGPDDGKTPSCGT